MVHASIENPVPGDGGGDDPQGSVLNRFYADLMAHFGPQGWWPGGEGWTVAVGAILVQNTNWRNVQHALAGLDAQGLTSCEAVLDVAEAELAEVIRPTGTHRVKARRLQAVARWWRDHSAVALEPATPLEGLRDSLLVVHGVGPETADCILLYAFGRPSFVIDAYTLRILRRHGLAAARSSVAEVRVRFMAALPVDVTIYNEYHALLVTLAKEHCRPKPRCEGCPLAWHPHCGEPTAL